MFYYPINVGLIEKDFLLLVFFDCTIFVTIKINKIDQIVVNIVICLKLSFIISQRHKV